MTGCSGEKSDWQQRVATADRNYALFIHDFFTEKLFKLVVTSIRR